MILLDRHGNQWDCTGKPGLADWLIARGAVEPPQPAKPRKARKPKPSQPVEVPE